MLILNLKSFFNIYFGWLHWWFTRFYSLAITSLLLTFNVDLVLGFTLFFLLHNCLGFEIIFEDYIYNEDSRQILNLLLRVLTILFARQCSVFFL
uniref:succinate:cytochrome c oxidoreductase subunit 4 n=1 Tax=Sahlingia subintegra TaxID=468936 RepID=UPI001FCCC318|nr:succinate:cytochrome c oxidoreductase subunit 4 [Sahlingia subintegra]UNJ19062.1 succinate:cytochrome c oxidoreductase subunit 4 [Sahlingia subintegra]